MKLIPKVYFTVTMLFPMLVSPGQTSQRTSSQEWAFNRHPQRSGWDSVALLRLKKFVTDSSFVTGMMIVHNGEVVFEYGGVKENSYIASCRKSVLAMLYGEHVASGKIELSTTIGELGILNEESVFQRIKAVNYADQIQQPDAKLLEALTRIMQQDPNTNVRLAATSSLGRFTDDSAVRDAMLTSLL